MITPEERVIYAVVNQAIFDACDRPIGRELHSMAMTENAKSAMRFIFSTDLDAYLKWTDLEPSWFRKKLLDVMFDSKNVQPFFANKERTPHRLDDSHKRAFRANYGMWQKNPYQSIMNIKDSEGDYPNVVVTKV